MLTEKLLDLGSKEGVKIAIYDNLYSNSNDTVKERIDLMPLDILERLMTDLKTPIKFSIQINESVE